MPHSMARYECGMCKAWFAGLPFLPLSPMCRWDDAQVQMGLYEIGLAWSQVVATGNGWAQWRLSSCDYRARQASWLLLVSGTHGSTRPWLRHSLIILAARRQ